jgi:hypothetical protein
MRSREVFSIPYEDSRFIYVCHYLKLAGVGFRSNGMVLIVVGWAWLSLFGLLAVSACLG